MPDIITVAEAAVPGFEAVSWVGLAAPAKTSALVIGKLNHKIARMLADADVAQRLGAQGAEAQPSTPEAFARFMRDETERARKVIAVAGIQINK